MFFLITGAAASGKTTTVRALRAWKTGILCHDADEMPAFDAPTRWRNLEAWVQRALEAQARGADFLLGAHSPLGELLTCPSAPELAGIAACLLDCADPVRIERIRARGIDPRWPPNQDTLSWASWLRMHATDPQWVPEAITTACPFPDLLARWRGWVRGDPRWQVPCLDTTALDVDGTLRGVQAWMDFGRGASSSLTPAARWWENGDPSSAAAPKSLV